MCARHEHGVFCQNPPFCDVGTVKFGMICSNWKSNMRIKNSKALLPLLASALIILLESFCIERTLGTTVSYDSRTLVIDGKRRVLQSGSIHYPRSLPEVNLQQDPCLFSTFVFIDEASVHFIILSICGAKFLGLARAHRESQGGWTGRDWVVRLLELSWAREGTGTWIQFYYTLSYLGSKLSTVLRVEHCAICLGAVMQYHFKGRFDLVRFVKTVKEAGLFVHLRIGPYACAEWNYGYTPVVLFSFNNATDCILSVLTNLSSFCNTWFVLFKTSKSTSRYFFVGLRFF